MTINKSKKRLMLAALGIVLAGVALRAAVNQTIAVGTLAHWDAFGGPATITMRTLTIAPGEILGWHHHPGVGAYTIVAEGTLVVEDGCGAVQVYQQGDAFLEPPNRVHRGKNLTTGPVVTAQTFLVPADTGISASVPQLCGAPGAVEECTNSGWMSFNHPRTFASQGDCLQYVITGK